jgi:hypothetical protein
MSPDPAILSYTQQATPPLFARLLMRPLGWIYFSTLALACLCALWFHRIPDSFSGALFTIALVAVFSILLLLRALLQVVLFRIYRRPWASFRPWRYAFPFAIAAVMAFLLATGLPARLAFSCSEPAMRAEAQRLLALRAAGNPWPAPYTTRLGAFDCWVDPDNTSKTVTFFIQGSGFLDRNGFTYSPHTPPPRTSRARRDTPYAPDWYYTHEEFL